MLHVQRTTQDWDRCLPLLPDDALVKAVNEASIFPLVKSVNPNLTTMLRHVGGTQNVWGGDLEHNKQVAREFFATFIDDTFKEKYAAHTNLVQEWNEYLASSHTGQELADRITWATAAAQVWNEEYRTIPGLEHIRLALVNAPVGNDIHPEFARIAIQYDCVLSYHAYSHFVGLNERDPLDFQYHSGRWNEMEKAWGNLKPDWVFGEAGPYAGVVDGWRSSRVLGGNREAYVEAVRAFIKDLQTTDAYKQGRLYGFGLFTTGRTDGGWDMYYTEQPELDMLAQMIAEEWAPGNEPVPDPDPEPDPDARSYARKVWLIPQNTIPSAYDGVKDIALPLRNTITFSVDDAFIDHPNLTRREVTVLNVTEIAGPGGAEALETWVNAHYPPVPQEIDYMTFQDLFLVNRWDSPVGTAAERAGDELWPGGWVDATGFLTKYALGYHTGADLNLNLSVWDQDRNMPVYPAASGKVIYAGTPSQGWQRVVIVKHVEKDDTVIYTRYAHLGEIMVKVGQWVKRHNILGTIGRNYAVEDEVWGPFHLHFDISPTTILKDDPGNWPGDNAQMVLDNYVAPLDFILSRRATM